jgi:hypothetical protein
MNGVNFNDYVVKKKRATHLYKLHQFNPQLIEQSPKRLSERLLILVRLLPPRTLLLARALLELIDHLSEREHFDQLELVPRLFEAFCSDTCQRERRCEADRQRGVGEERKEQADCIWRDRKTDINPPCSID